MKKQSIFGKIVYWILEKLKRKNNHGEERFP